MPNLFMCTQVFYDNDDDDSVSDSVGSNDVPFKSKIVFLQINLGHSKVATACLAKRLDQILERGGQFVCCIQEPWIDGTGSIAGFSKSLRVNCKGKRPRAAIITSLDTQCAQIDSKSNRDNVFCVTKFRDLKLQVISSYLDINEDLHGSLFERNCRNLNDAIVCVDSNSHNIVWGCHEDNYRGEVMLEILTQNNLSVLNDPLSEPTFMNARSSSHIDLTISKGRVAANIQNWQVEHSKLFSDHGLVTFSLPFRTSSKAIENFNLKECNWEQYTQILQTLDLPVTNPCKESLDSFAEKFESNIWKAVAMSAPLSRGNPCRSLVPWWNPDLKRIKKEVRKAFRTWYTLRDEESRSNYCRLKNFMKSEVNKAKRTSWRTYTSGLKTEREVATFVRNMQNKERNRETLIKDSNGVEPESLEESLENLVNYHFPNNEEPKNENEILSSAQHLNERAEKYINSERVRYAISTFKPVRAPGYDRIKPVMLQNLPLCYVDALTEAFKNCVKSSYTPKKWRETRVVFIPKVGKTTFSEPKNLRPITLASFVIKVLQKVIQIRLRETTLAAPLKKQHAYTRGRSTDSALMNFVHKVEKGLLQKQFAVVTLIDISGAFDSITFANLKNQMKKRGIDPEIVDWYLGFASNKRAHVYYHGIEKVIRPTQGNGQGENLSADFWNICFQELVDLLLKTQTSPEVYADDLSLCDIGPVLSVVTENAQATLSKVEAWSDSRNLKLSVQKTVPLVITRRRKFETTNLTLCGRQLEYGKGEKYLGVTINKSLTWSAHILDKIKQCKGKLFSLRGAIGRKWGLDAQKILWVYKMVILPKLLYGAVVWFPGTENVIVRQKLDSLQRLVMIMMSFCMRSTPTKPLEILFGLPPLHLVAQEKALMTAFRLRDEVDWNNWDGLPATGQRKGTLRLLYDKLESLKCLKSCDRINTLVKWERPSLLCGNLANFNFDGKIVIYTDGSKMEDHVGGGWVVTRGDMALDWGCFQIASEASVYQAETKAIEIACDEIIGNRVKYLGKEITFLLDNMASIQSITGIEIKSKTVLKAREKLQFLEDELECKINIGWVKGHSDCCGNEVADMLAKRGCFSDFKVEIDLPFSYFKQAIHDDLFEAWERDWQSTGDCRQSKHFLTNTKQIWSKRIMAMSTEERKLLISLVTGHSCLRRHTCLMGLTDVPTCRLCGWYDETVDHLMHDCPATTALSYRVSGNADYINGLLEFLYDPTVKKLFTSIDDF